VIARASAPGIVVCNTRLVRLRRAQAVSLLVALMALAGATTAPTFGAGRTGRASIVWQAGDQRQAPHSWTSPRRVARLNRRPAPPAPTVGARATASPVRHRLFERPPPAFSQIAVS
jgi:hypothetical protein